MYCASSPLPAAQMPDPDPLTGRRVTVAATDPPLPPGRRILLSGTGAATGGPVTESATVASCTVTHDGASMRLELTAGLVNSFARLGLVVQANVVTATHGETVQQVLGSGPGGAGTFTTYQPRRTPLTYLRATTPDGAAAELTVARGRRGLDAGAVPGRGRPAGPGVRPAPGRGRHGPDRHRRRRARAAAGDRPGERHRHLPGGDRRTRRGRRRAAHAAAPAAGRHHRGDQPGGGPGLGPAGDARRGAAERAPAGSHPRPGGVGDRLRGLRARVRRGRPGPGRPGVGRERSAGAAQRAGHRGHDTQQRPGQRPARHPRGGPRPGLPARRAGRGADLVRAPGRGDARPGLRAGRRAGRRHRGPGRRVRRRGAPVRHHGHGVRGAGDDQGGARRPGLHHAAARAGHRPRDAAAAAVASPDRQATDALAALPGRWEDGPRPAQLLALAPGGAVLREPGT